MYSLGVVVCLLALCTVPLHAVQLDYTDDREPELKECDALSYVGQTEAARGCFETLLENNGNDNSHYGLRAAAAHALGQFKVANRLYREAVELEDPLRNTTRWGDLYAEAHQPGEASSLYREALAIDETYLPAQLGLAAAQGRQFEGRAREILVAVLREHPDSLRATLLMARLELEVQRVDPARLLLERAEQLANSQSKPVLEVYALQAAADLLDGITNSEWTTKALEVNPHYGDVYSIPAHFYIITYRYREAVDLYRKATQVQPDHADAQSSLGINLLRINNIFGARTHLEKAYSLDPFNTETVNTLKLLDDLDDMRVTHADIYPEPRTAGDKPFGRMLLRLDRDSVDALEPYVIELTARAVRAFTERYEFSLAKPVVVELYHNHDDFGVRTVSTPGVGLLGVTFGYVLAMDSPKARSPNDFHWGSTLWHELAHVFTLEAANHLLPRWFSEGISVYEEWNTGPLPNRELPMQVLRMFEEDRFLPVADLDRGFVRPTYEGQVTVSYMQAGMICDFIAERWGHQALVKMLKRFAIGMSTEVALSSVIKISSKEFDKLFAEHVTQRYANILANQDNWQHLGQMIANLIGRGDNELTANWEQVRDLSQQRIDYYPEHVGENNAYMSLATAHENLGQPIDALSARWEWFKRGGSVPASLSDLARDLRVAGRDDDAFEVLEALNWVMPYFVEEHRLLGQYYLDKGESTKAIREYNALLGVRPEDAGVALLGKARAYQAQDNIDLARLNVLYALEHAPFFRDAQQLLLELTAGE